MRSDQLNKWPSMRRSLRLYGWLAGVTLLARLVIAVWPVQAIDSSQAAVLQWSIFVPVLLLGFPAMHAAHRWGVPKDIIESPFTPGFLQALGMGFASALLFIAWDLLFVLPRDINVIGVISIPYYLTGAFLVEVMLHLIPLALWLGLVGRLLFRDRHDITIFWIGAGLVTALEPLTQLGGGVFEGYGAAFFVISAVIIYGVNFLQLVLFRHGGFVPMLAFRIGLYLLWHVIWGPIRLQVLF